jgi:hypothetical protein
MILPLAFREFTKGEVDPARRVADSQLNWSQIIATAPMSAS